MTLPPTRLHPRQGATTVRCLPGSEWMRNSKDQTPCLVASWAIVPCRGTNGEPWVIGPIHPGGPFLGPSPTSDLFQCRCNTVFYSLLAACGACQGYHGQDGIQNLTVHMSPCPPGLLVHREYPQEIRPETAIPAWAYLDIVNDQWDEQGAIALALQDVPDSTHAADSSTSSLMVPTLQPSSQSLTVGQPVASPNQSASGAGSASASPTADLNSSGSTQSSSVVGPAIGGAVGGLAALLLVLTGVVLCLRRRRSKRPVVAVLPPAGMDYHDHYVHPATLTLYNPDDPNTYPSAQSESRGGTRASSDPGMLTSANSGVTDSTSQDEPRYRGLGEVI